MKPPILFSRCGSNLDITMPVVGSVGTVTGTPSYSGCKFGNGIYSADATSYASWPVLSATEINAGFSLSFFVNPEFASTSSAGIAACFLSAYDAIAGSWISIYYDFPYGPYYGKLTVDIYDGTAWGSRNLYALTFSAGDVFHIGATFDKTRSAGDMIKIFFNNAEVAPSSSVFTAGWTFPNAMTFKTTGEPATYGGYPHAVIDNLKIWDYVKADFSGYLDERSGMNDQVIIV